MIAAIRTGFLAALFVFVALPAHAQHASEVRMHHGRPTLFVDGVPQAPVIYALTDVPGGRWSWEEVAQHNIAGFCAQGVRLFQLDVFLDDLWFEDGRFDLGVARRQIAGVQEVCPEGRVFFRFHVTAPKWWMRQHPDEWVAYADVDYEDEQHYGLLRIIEDDNNPVRRVSMASEAWRTSATEKLRQFLRAFEETPEGDALVGVQVANGVYGEWHNWGFYRNEPDVSGPMNAYFRDWLREKYGSVDALREAWADPAVTFETAEVPGMDARATTRGVFRDPQAERRAIDYYECVHQLVADNIIHFARVVKEEWPRPIVAGTFYGYYFSTFGRQAAGGHLQLQSILASPHLDYLSGPQAYEPQSMALGDPYRSRSLITSIRLHGKLWLDEMDVEPTIPMLRDPRYHERIQNSLANVRRNVLFTYTKGMGLWFYDFGPSGVDLDGYRHRHKGSQGNWDHPVLMHDIGEMKRLVEERLGTDYESEADVLFVYDTDSFYHTASLRGTDPVSSTLIDFNTLSAFRSGIVFDPIHVDDLSRVDLSKYRTVVFGNVYLLSEEERAFIRERVARDGRHLVWFYAPGYTDGERLDAGAVSALTQVGVRPTMLASVPQIALTGVADTAVVYTVGEEPFGPLFAVDDPEAEPLGHYAETGEAAVARKVLDDHTAWYVALPSKGVEPMRHILHASGAHVYNDTGDLFYAGGGLIVLHTLEGGPRPVTLRDGRRVTVDLPPGVATAVLDAATGAVLLGGYDEAMDARWR